MAEPAWNERLGCPGRLAPVRLWLPSGAASAQPVSVGTMPVSVTYQVRVFSIRMTLR
jgi:hypothetical protein